MKNVLLISLAFLFVSACGNSSNNTSENSTAKTEANTSGTIQETDVADSNTVYVYYFHGKQRCKTCIAVEQVTKDLIDSNYAEEPNVKFLVVLTEDQANKELVEKYEIGWNSLIIAKGDNSSNITEEAFANAIKKPEALVELIKQEVNSRL